MLYCYKAVMGNGKVIELEFSSEQARRNSINALQNKRNKVSKGDAEYLVTVKTFERDD